MRLLSTYVAVGAVKRDNHLSDSGRLAATPNIISLTTYSNYIFFKQGFNPDLNINDTRFILFILIKSSLADGRPAAMLNINTLIKYLKKIYILVLSTSNVIEYLKAFISDRLLAVCSRKIGILFEITQPPQFWHIKINPFDPLDPLDSCCKIYRFKPDLPPPWFETSKMLRHFSVYCHWPAASNRKITQPLISA